MIGVEDDWNSVAGSDASDVVRTSDSAHDRGCLVLVVDTFSAEVCCASLAHLKYNGGLIVSRGFECCNDLEAVLSGMKEVGKLGSLRLSWRSH